MPVIRVEMFEGRTRDQKRSLVKVLTQGFIGTCGGKPEAIQIVITNVAKEDWGGGGVLMADKYPV
jgi:4-oxalocrotonate tautomerase